MNEDMKKDFGKDVESLIRICDQAKMDLTKSRMGLLEMGVKVVKDGVLAHLPGLDIGKYEKCNNQEFYWEAEFKDGRILKQFEGSKQFHYGHIDQSQLKLFRWVSNFSYQTANEDKRVIVTLDFETGKFSFHNGMCPQEVRGEVESGYPVGEFVPKLILKVVRRTSTSLSYPDGEIDEVAYYNRYLIGWENSQESKVAGKRILVIEPNGFIHL